VRAEGARSQGLIRCAQHFARNVRPKTCSESDEWTRHKRPRTETSPPPSTAGIQSLLSNTRTRHKPGLQRRRRKRRHRLQISRVWSARHRPEAC
jgi:hypothetical protein